MRALSLLSLSLWSLSLSLLFLRVASAGGRRLGALPVCARYTSHTRLVLVTQATRGLYSLRKPRAACSRYTSHTRLVLATQATRGLYSLHKPHAACIRCTSHTRFVFAAQVPRGLYSLHKPHAACARYTSHTHGLCSLQKPHAACVVQATRGLCLPHKPHAACLRYTSHTRLVLATSHFGAQATRGLCSLKKHTRLVLVTQAARGLRSLHKPHVACLRYTTSSMFDHQEWLPPKWGMKTSELDSSDTLSQ